MSGSPISAGGTASASCRSSVSALRDDFGDESDLDLLVEFEPKTSIGMEFIDLQLALEDLLGRRVDLVPKPGLRPLIRDRVLSTARVLYAV